MLRKSGVAATSTNAGNHSKPPNPQEVRRKFAKKLIHDDVQTQAKSRKQAGRRHDPGSGLESEEDSNNLTITILKGRR